MMISRGRPTFARHVVAAALATFMSGCSFVSVQRPRSPAEIADPRLPDTCTTTPASAIADSVLGGAGVAVGYVATVVGLMGDMGCSRTATSGCSSGNAAPGLAILGAGAAFVGSAIYGYVSTAQCRHRIRAGGRCGTGDLGACQRLKPGWVPPAGWRAGGILEPNLPPAPAVFPSPSPSEWTQEPAPPRGGPPAP